MSGDRASLEKKDKGELQTIVEALGGKAPARATKATLITSIIELSGAPAGASEDAEPAAKSKPAAASASDADDEAEVTDEADDSEADDSGSDKSESSSDDRDDSEDDNSRKPKSKSSDRGKSDSKKDRQKKSGKDGSNKDGGNKDSNKDGGNKDEDNFNAKDRSEKREDEDGNRRRRRGRGRGRDREEDGVKAEPEPVAGFLDLRDEGYGFLRVDGFLPTKEDIYVSVKQVRLGALRRGDYLTGSARPASRNEKNAALHSLETVNGKVVDESSERPLFDNLTPIMPTEQLVLERNDATNNTGRVIDLLAPIGKGQRGLVVSPPQAGKTSTLIEIAKSVQVNSPDSELILLLVDERPEEVTEITRQLEGGDVMASTFDRPPDEHTAVAELTMARAQRLVEDGDDVVVLIDGITRLARAYNQSVPHAGRPLGGGLDAAAVHPTKRLFGMARNLEEGGSLTVIATVAVETGSELDTMIYTEFSGTANMELRLNRELAAKRTYPAIDVVASRTTGEDKMFSESEMAGVSVLRKALIEADEANGRGAGMTALAEALAKSKSNEDFLAKAAKGKAL